MSVSTFDLIARFGVRVIEVPHLGQDAIYVAEHHIALIEFGLWPDRRQMVADWVLSEAGRPALVPRGPGTP